MDKKSPASNPIWWFLGVMTFLWFIWFFTGGPERAQNAKPFLKPPAPLDTGEQYGNPGDILKKDTYRSY